MTPLQLFTLIHTAISLVAIISGILVMKGLIASHGRQLWTILFQVTAWLTTLTGFFFPFKGVTPAFILGVISLIPLTLASLGRYPKRLAGSWRGTYVISSVTVLYFNFFVLIVQSFQKIPFLNAFAPTQSEPPFKIAQLLNLILFIVLGVMSYKRFRPKVKEPELNTGYVSPRRDDEGIPT